MVNMILPSQVGFYGVLVAGLADMEGFDVIIGMDIITRGDFAITNVDGRTCVTYRVPSVQKLDFVEEAKAIKRDKRKARREAKAGAEGKPARNAPCSCGSGKKYKKCCMLRDDVK
jgi:hypothetical protein